MAYPKLVAQLAATRSRTMLSSSEPTKDTFALSQARNFTSTKEDELWVFVISGLLSGREAFQSRLGTLSSSHGVTPRKKKQYHTYIANWFVSCEQKINQIRPTINNVLKFLFELCSIVTYSIYTTQLKFSKDFNLMPHFE